LRGVLPEWKGDEAISIFLLFLDGRRGGQASSEDLFPLGYGEWETVRVSIRL
jgi:hypothetical protein